MKSLIFILMLFTTSLFAGKISILSDAMAIAVMQINAQTNAVMNGYISSFDEILEKQKDNQELYEKRRENSDLILKKNKNIQVLLQNLQFEYSKDKDIEALRKKNQNVLLLPVLANGVNNGR